MEVVGVENLMQVSPNVQPIFLLPPNYEEWQRRLAHRGFMSEEELSNRMTSAKFELTMALEKDYYHFVVNDTLAHAVQQVHDVATGESADQQQAAGRAVAEAILKKIK